MPAFVTSFLQLKREYIIASLLTAGLALFIIISLLRGTQALSSEEGGNTQYLTVISQPSTATQHAQSITLYGFTEAQRRIDIRPETGGRIKEILATEGMPVAEGDVIATLALENRPERLAFAKALVKQRTLEHKVSQELSKQGLESDTKLANAYTQLVQAKSELKTIEQDIDYTVITSPFDGILERLHVEMGDIVKPREAVIATVVDTSPLLAVGYVSEQHIQQLSLQQTAHITFANNETLEGTVDYISHVANASTRTFRVEIAFDNHDYHYADGLSAEIHIPTRSVLAHHVPSSILSLGKKGVLGIYTTVPLTEENTEQKPHLHKVHFYPVTLLDEDVDGVWISGLPETVSIITRGQGFVSEGDTVHIDMPNQEGN